MLTLQPEIAQAMIFGDRRPYMVAVVVPDAEWTQQWCAREGDACNFKRLAENSEYRTAIAHLALFFAVAMLICWFNAALRATQESLRRSESNFRSLVMNAPSAIDTRVTWMASQLDWSAGTSGCAWNSSTSKCAAQANSTDVTNLINWVRGDTTYDGTTGRKRSGWILGDIVYSTSSDERDWASSINKGSNLT